MIAKINNRYNTITEGDSPMDFNKILTIIKENPIKLLLFSFIFGAATLYMYNVLNPVYVCWDSPGTDNHPTCFKYRVYPPPTTPMGQVSNSRCPINPATHNCPL